MSLKRRISRLEQSSFLGTQAELDECEFLFMRVPPDYLPDTQFEKSPTFAGKLGTQPFCLDSAASHSLPLWGLLPLDRLPDELLDEQVTILEHRLGIGAVQSRTMENWNG